MISLIFLFAFILSVSSQVCVPAVLTPTQWAIRFPTINAFTGFYKANGNIQILDPFRNVLLQVNLNGSVWRQYYGTGGLLYGDLFLNGLVPGALVLTSRLTVNPIPFKNDRVCQNFFLPTPPNLILSYSELLSLTVGYMTSYYVDNGLFSTKRAISNEIFDFDDAMNNAFSETNSIVRGIGPLHFTNQVVTFLYEPITEAQAISLGWTPSLALFTSVKGIFSGRSSIPIEVFTPEQRQQFGL
jgi:hypothetical protein